MTHTAKQTQQGNALSWEFFTPAQWNPDHSIESLPEKLSWEGYNSPSWWAGPCQGSWYRQITDSQGRTWEVDFHTNQVILNS